MASTNFLSSDFPDPSGARPRLERMARKWAMEFDANSLITLGRAMSSFNILDQLTQIKARVLFVLSRTDNVFPPSIAPEAMSQLQAAGIRAEYFEIDSDLGHSASGLDGDKWAPKLAEFMAQLTGRN
ncbi:MAG: hypothetical protein R3C59_20510 [Planctomycetaceae bacterium]